MKRLRTKVLFLALVGSVALALAGCGKDKGEIASKDYIYRAEELAAIVAEFGNNSSFTMLAAGDNLYIYGTAYSDDYSASELRIVKIDKTGNILGTARFPLDNIYIGTLTGSSDGRIFTVKTVYNYSDGGGGDIDIMPMPAVPRENVLQLQGQDMLADDDTDDADIDMDDTDAGTDDIAEPAPEPAPRGGSRGTIETEDNAIIGEGVYQPEQHYLIELFMDGSERELACLNDNRDLNDQEWFYVNQIFSLPNGVILVNAMEKLAVYDTNGNYQGLVLTFLNDNPEEYGYGRSYFVLSDGRTMFSYWNNNATVVREFNIANDFIGDAIALGEEGRPFNYSIFAGSGGYDLFLASDRELYGYNIGGEMVKLMDIMDSDLFISGFNSMYGVDAERFFAAYYDYATDRQLVSLFTKVRPEDIVDKVEITLGAVWMDWNVRREIVNFNKSNENYRITMIDYGSQYNTYDDWNSGVTHLNNDIVAGRAPDIMVLDGNMPFQSYMAKGLFADLIPLINRDPDINLDDLMPNVVEAYSMDGKMYQLIPHFFVYTAVAKTSEVGPNPGWTIADAQALLASKPPETSLFDVFMNRDTILQNSVAFSASQFIDWEAGRCSFDSPAFISLLELMKDYPEEIDYSMYERGDFWQEYEAAYRTGRVLVSITTISSLRDFNRLAHGQFGAEVTPIGFPNEGGLGAALQSSISFAVAAKSRNQAGAWEFLRYFLSEDYQTNQGWSLPVLRSAYDQRAQEAMERPYWTDENGARQEYDDTWYIDGQEVVIPPMTRAEVDRLTEYILSVMTPIEYNQTLMDIIKEEAGAYFAGQKSAQEVVAIIQSRAQIYVSENS
jgi:ABC-type glycerol-3-phosphate transport system substrate-binding protein